MNSPKTKSIATALGALEQWFETIHGPEGYTGPVVGMRGRSMAFCGAGFDWRYEGLLDGWIELYQQTQKAEYLNRIEQALRELASAQLRNGSFRNSYFEDNPFEGGMPYEPATVAAICRAQKCLSQASRSTSLPERIIERFVELRCIRELWCKNLQTFNNWMQSDFEDWSPMAVASIAEIMISYTEITDDERYISHYAQGAIDSILRLQHEQGAIPISKAKRKLVSPFFMARCLPAIKQMAVASNSETLHEAADRAFQSIEQSRTESGFPHLIFPNKDHESLPSFTGAIASIHTASHRAGFKPSGLKIDLSEILERQNKAGGFATANGFGKHIRHEQADWRDVLPCAGWNDKVYHLLALHQEGAPKRQEISAAVRHVNIKNRTGIYTEDAKRIHIEDHKGHPLFDWKKKQTWAEISLL